MHIVRVANFVSPTSGGIKTALRAWGEVYRERGHRVSLIIPAQRHDPPVTHEAQGTVFRVPAQAVLKTGYSLIWSRRGLSVLLEALRPDTIEVSDRSTLRWTGGWARRRSIAAIMISHEQLSGIIARRTPLPEAAAGRVADVINRRSAADYDAIVCPSGFAAREFHRAGAKAHVVPLGVDLDTFAPGRAPSRAPEQGLHMVHCGRLSREKNPGLSLATVRELRARGVAVQLTVLGHGPMRDALMHEARDLPVRFHPYITDRAQLARAIRRAHVAIAPGPVETFGLAALEALACGVPTVCPVEGALGEVVGGGGWVAASRGPAFADGVQALLQRPDARTRARAQAERFTWHASADQMLDLHRRVTR